MKRFKVFKIIYYGFMVVVGIILCFILPGYNQYNALTKEIKNDIKTENYGDLPGFFASYYNNKQVAESSNESSKIMVYEAANYEKLGTSDYYYAQPVYMTFVFNVDTFDQSTVLDSNGNTVDNKTVIYSDGTTEYKVPFTDENTYYVSELDFIYFILSESQFEDSGLTSITEISVIDGKNEEFISTNTSNLNFKSDYFTVADQYISIFNQMYSNLQLTVNYNNGKITKNETNTTVEANGQFTFTPTGPTILRLEASDVSKYTVSGATLIEGETNRYQMVNDEEVTIKAKEATTIDGIVIEVGEFDIRYSFDGKTTGDYNYQFEETSTNNVMTILGAGYSEDDQQEEFEAWLEAYTYTRTNYQEALEGITTKTIIQIIVFFIVMLVIGDFIVGKHYIVYFFTRLFGKKGKKKEEEEVIKNEYDVNFACSVYVPAGYNKPVKLVYKKDDNHIVEFELLKEHNYKSSIRTQNGIYKFVSYEAEGLHPLKKLFELNVRGYRFELDVKFGYDEKEQTETVIDDEVVDAIIVEDNK